MTDVELQEDLPPVAHVTMVYTGPIAPHWDLQIRYGDQKLLDDFWARVNARLLLLPKHDPQFRRNKERVNRDAERERITCDWDLGEDDADTTITPVVETVPVEPAAAAADQQPEAAPELETEAPAEAEPEAAPLAETEAEPEAAPVAETEASAEAESEAAPELETEAEGAGADAVVDDDAVEGEESEQPAEI